MFMGKYLWVRWGRDPCRQTSASFGFGVFPRGAPGQGRLQPFLFKFEVYWDWLPPRWYHVDAEGKRRIQRIDWKAWRFGFSG